MIIDVNAYVGSWPFAPHEDRSGRRLAAHLAEAGIARALVSHLGAVFQADPMPANRALSATLRQTPALVPLPVINPTLANWREQLAACAALTPVRAVRVIPGYQNYSLRSARLAALMETLAETNTRLVLTARLEDERHRYFALGVKGLKIAAVAAFLRRFPKHHVLCTGLTLGEILQLETTCKNFSADVSFAENIKMMETLRARHLLGRIMFGSLTPLVSARAQAAKVTSAPLPAAARKLVEAENARRFFSL